MKKQIGLETDNFNDLLNWFSANREEAGQEYEKIRNGLIRFFYFKGCADAESLADETFNRVAAKLSALDLSKKIKPANVCYGFASKIFLEYINGKNNEIEFNADFSTPALTEEAATEPEKRRQKCLTKCLVRLTAEESDLIVGYYSLEKSEKVNQRKKMADKLNVKSGALHVKVHRVRKILRKCVEKCAAENNL